MKRIFAVMITAVFLFAVTAAPALAAEQYVIDLLPGPGPSLLSTTITGTSDGYAFLDYVIPEGIYDVEFTLYHGSSLICEGYGEIDVSYEFSYDESTLTEVYFSTSVIPIVFSFDSSTFYDLQITFGYMPYMSGSAVFASCLDNSTGESTSALLDGAVLVLTPKSGSILSGLDTVSGLLASSFDMMISNPLTTTLTAAGLIGVAVPVFVKLKKSARR